MINFDTWQQAVETQLDREAAVIEHTEDYYGPWARLADDYYGIVSQMDDDDSEYWELETALHMDACIHELSTMTI